MCDAISKDFERDVYLLFGVPIDNMTIQSTKDYLYSRTNLKSPAVWSTVNVNWIVQSLRDEEFRKAIINSDLVTLDGRPLLWLSRLFGYPMTEVVPGSSMIQELHEDIKSPQKLSIFFFGGEGDVGFLAMKKVNAQPSGLKAVGAINPGFGTVDEMSSIGIIEAINKAKPDILLVALGAKKGTAWIEHNRNKLDVKIISHLGATVNFLAGTVKRAPSIFQKIGMEWLWRILQEPKLFFRYASDGWVMSNWILKQFSVWKQFRRMKKRLEIETAVEEVTESIHGNRIILSFGISISRNRTASIRQIFSKCVRAKNDVTLDFQKTEYVCGEFMALVLILEKNMMQNGCRFEMVNVQEPLTKLFRFF